MARFDLERGHYTVLGYGLPCCEVQEYKRLLKEHYGIEHKQIALCNEAGRIWQEGRKAVLQNVSRSE